MHRIGEFSILSKTTIKALRYYEKEKLLIPSYVDDNGYRYYETTQLIDLAKIISLKQVGMSIENIKRCLAGENLNELLNSRKQQLEKNLKDEEYQLLKINYLLEENKMKYEVIVKELPEYTVYYQDGLVKDFNQIVDFILSSGEKCRELNPNIKCIEPDYCYLNYLDREYKESNFHIRYAQAVTEEGISNEEIKFMKLNPVNAVCIYHKGSYDKLPEAYAYIMEYIDKNGYEIIEDPRERYIDGMWNKESKEDWLTEIQVPVIKK